MERLIIYPWNPGERHGTFPVHFRGVYHCGNCHAPDGVEHHPRCAGARKEKLITIRRAALAVSWQRNRFGIPRKVQEQVTEVRRVTQSEFILHQLHGLGWRITAKKVWRRNRD